jgi:hypothetical protein
MNASSYLVALTCLIFFGSDLLPGAPERKAMRGMIEDLPAYVSSELYAGWVSFDQDCGRLHRSVLSLFHVPVDAGSEQENGPSRASGRERRAVPVIHVRRLLEGPGKGGAVYVPQDVPLD